jgi:hypothetical protein
MPFCSPNFSEFGTPNLFFLGRFLVFKFYKKYCRGMLQEYTLFSLFQNFEKYLIDHIECPIIFHDIIEESKMNNFCSRSTSRKCSVKVVGFISDVQLK